MELLGRKLSPREIEIYYELTETADLEKFIASRLNISPHTMKTHVGAIYAKLGVHGRLELLVGERKRALANGNLTVQQNVGQL